MFIGGARPSYCPTWDSTTSVWMRDTLFLHCEECAFNMLILGRNYEAQCRNHKLSLHITSKLRRALFLQVTLRTIGIDSTRAPVLWPQEFDHQGRRMQLNAYALDFYKHGSLTGLVQDNRCVLSVSVSISLPSHPQHPCHPQHPHLYLYLSLSFSPLPLSLCHFHLCLYL